MTYTAKKLADLSGISVRTLHWYDKIGLLAPDSIGDNGYRYYKREQLLLLQQILFYRELGIKLEDIREIITRSDFDKAKALRSHKEQIKSKIGHFQTLLKTIDSTISNLEEGSEINDEDLYKGFNEWLQDNPDSTVTLVDTKDSNYQPSPAEKIVLAKAKKGNRGNWSKSQWEKVLEKNESNLNAIKVAMESGISPTSKEVQKLIEQHYDQSKEFYEMDVKVYTALAELFLTHDAFRSQLEQLSDRMPNYMSKAMKHFCKQRKGK